MSGTPFKIDYPKMLRSFVDELLSIMVEAESLEKTAITQQHTDAEAALNKWLKAKGATGDHQQTFEQVFGQPLPAQWPKEPDILILDRTNKILYVGEAKNADIETDKNTKTVSRIRFYLILIQILLTRGLIDKAHFALITNQREVALSWQTTLTTIAAEVGLLSSTGGAATFQLTELPDQSFWIANI